MSRNLYGSPVVDGTLRYLSPSALTLADPASEGCERKWWYAYIQKIRAPQSKAQMRGVDLHGEIERYLKTGDRSLSSLALSGMHMVPDPMPPGGGELGSDLGIELDIAGGSLETAPVLASGVPILGYIDLVHARGTNKGSTSIEDTIDPPGTIEVLDWKTTSDPRWIKSAKEMANTIQMTTYGRWVLTVEPAAQQIRLSHGYFVERGGPSRKVTLRVLPEHINRNWEHVEGVARIVRDVARETDPDRVPANTRVCDRFGGCPARDVCKARMHQALVSFVGQTAADKLLGKHQEQETTMGLLDKMKASAGAPAPTPPPAIGVTATSTETSVSLGIGALIGTPAPQPDPAVAEAARAAERAKLEAEETAQRAAAQLRAAADKFAPFLAKLEAYAAANPDIGMPTFTDDAAHLYMTIKGAAPAPGSGKLAAAPVPDLATIEQFVAQLDVFAAQGQIKPAASGGPSPLAGLTGGLLAPEAPAPTPVHPTATTTAVASATVQMTANIPTAPPPVTTSPPPADDKTDKAPKAKKPKVSNGTTVNVIVDGVAEIPGATFESLHPTVEAILGELAQNGNDIDLRAAGLRGAEGKLVFDKDASPFAFGRGDGAVGALFRERPLPPGFYYFSTRGNRLYEIVADALRVQCQKTGGIFVWGGR